MATLAIVAYPGGKNGAGVYQKLINLMPPHDRYFEPFLGAGAIIRMKRPARENYGLDLVASQVQAVKYSICNSAGAAGSITLDGERRRSPVPAVSAEPATSGVARRRRSPVPAVLDPRAPDPKGPAASPSPLAGAGDVRSRFTFLHASAFDFLERPSIFAAGDLVYCDPPYLLETRKGRRLYEHELSSLEHLRLLRCIRKLPCMVMLSGYWSEMYAQALKDWNVFHFQAMTRGGTMADEYVWFNFPRPTALHDYGYLGVGYRDRERIKKKKKRWVATLGRMPLLERQALLSAIADTGF